MRESKVGRGSTSQETWFDGIRGVLRETEGVGTAAMKKDEGMGMGGRGVDD